LKHTAGNSTVNMGSVVPQARPVGNVGNDTAKTIYAPSFMQSKSPSRATKASAPAKSKSKSPLRKGDDDGMKEVEE